ncbi:dihydroneopterin aldolase [Pararhodobacter aggregans]|uniref:Diguanylate cyclase n=1 Tax=Pararhodobacter aggregans TaxID=404875 RepID=A0A2T7UVX2_9RHOB|nr:dihydroneopterin aldolase [Pararhodobacter aggregans]PTW99559.1 dihydroneopterin aldolase [Pararhodobacter aggregans]PVE48887.1 diguanylate cyclase [Pararhodobacter aggregans]
MSTDIHLAFAHPEERAEATASADPRDRIALRDYLAEAEIGAFQTERGHSQRLMFNVVVEVRPPQGPIDDDVDRIMSYDTITEAITDALAAGRLNLLETLAESVAERILTHPRAMRAFVRIEKLDRGPFKLGVEIARTRAATPLQVEGTATHPLVVYMDNAAIAAPDFPDRIDRLEARGAPIILCTGLPDLPRPEVAVRAVQQRIDLLSVGLNAWALAARDRRCLVVESRTEIDWAIRQGRTIVWAPSKLVLDAPDGPVNHAHNGPALALWLAETLAASALLLPWGVTLPAGTRIPLETFPG